MAREYQPGEIRNLVLLGHNGVGKTSVAEGILFAAGVTKRFGKVEDGTSTLDFSADEIERKITINLGIANFDWKNIRLNLIDTPGYADFYGDVVTAVDVADCAVLVVRADAGVEVGTEKVWHFVERKGLPAAIIVNRMDREHANFQKVIEALRDGLRIRPVPVFLPLGQGDKFEGVIDLIGKAVYRYKADGTGTTKREDLPASEEETWKAGHAAIIEAAAEADDSIMERYLEGEEISNEEMLPALVEAIHLRKAVPVVPVSALKNIGFHQVLEDVERIMPSPLHMGETQVTAGGAEKARPPKPEGPLTARVFKTLAQPQLGDLTYLRVYSGTLKAGSETWNASRGAPEKIGQLYHMVGKERHEVTEIKAGDFGAAVKLRGTHAGDTLSDKNDPGVLPDIPLPKPHIAMAIEAKTKGDEDKIGNGLARLQEEDPTFHVRVDAEMHQTIAEGLGELHLDVQVDRLKRRFGVEVELVKPRIPYRETIRGKAEAQGRHKKQTGGRGQYGDVWLRLEALPRGTGFEFVDDIVGGSVPGKYVPAVEKGVQECLTDGVLANCKVVDLRTTIYDGSYHDVDSSDMAFKLAAHLAFKKAFMDARPVLLEPIWEITVTVPEDNLGDVMGDLSGRRGKILGVDAKGHSQEVKALVPLAELYKYSTQLRSLTQGRGMHEAKFSHYEEMPKDAMDKVIAEAEAARKAEH